jgi:hypothetical protein
MDKKVDDCLEEEDLEDLLEETWNMQDQIHQKCKMKDKNKNFK